MRRSDRYNYVLPDPDRVMDLIRRHRESIVASQIPDMGLLLRFQGTRMGQVRCNYRLTQPSRNSSRGRPPLPQDGQGSDWDSLAAAVKALCKAAEAKGDKSGALRVVLTSDGSLLWWYTSDRPVTVA